MNLYFLLTGAAALSLIYWVVQANKARQLKYIERYYFHKGIRQKLSQKHPQLTESQLDMVFQGLNDYFRMCHRARSRMVSMPSQVVDDAWNEFIPSTSLYEKFCNKALPLIFAMDGLLNIDNGFTYRLDCKKHTANGYCASHIGCFSGCGGGD